jgi:hypothetical protein
MKREKRGKDSMAEAVSTASSDRPMFRRLLLVSTYPSWSFGCLGSWPGRVVLTSHDGHCPAAQVALA